MYNCEKGCVIAALLHYKNQSFLKTAASRVFILMFFLADVLVLVATSVAIAYVLTAGLGSVLLISSFVKLITLALRLVVLFP
jgi:hypothetical protein